MGNVPRDGSATRGRILDAAEMLVERNGFGATSIDQILAEARTSKGAFFHHFESKKALARALVERYVDVDLALLGRGLDSVANVEDPVDRVLGFLGFYERWSEKLVSKDSGCLYIPVLTERDLLDDATAVAVERAILTWRVEFVTLLRPALATTAAGRCIEPEELADHLFATFEGGYLMCRSLRSAEPMRAQLRVLRQLVSATLGRDFGLPTRSARA